MMCVLCVCVFPVLSSLLFWTSGLWTYQPGSRRRKATQDFSYTFLLRCMPFFIFLARRIQPFLSLVDRKVECCVLTIFHLLGIFFLFFFCEEKYQFV